jgi:hypothetical protein
LDILSPQLVPALYFAVEFLTIAKGDQLELLDIFDLEKAA